MKKTIVVLFTSLLLLGGCGGGSEDNYNLKSDPTQVDISAPIITILGANSMNLSVGDTFSDPGAKAFDDINGDLTHDIKKISNINTAIAGTYAVNYSVSDTAGNFATAKRSVVVNDTRTNVGESIIIQNSVNKIWEDMTGVNTGYASNMPAGYAQFRGPLLKNINNRPDSSVNEINIWFEVEAAGDGGDCSLDTNRATNTKVQIGWTRGYYLMNDNSWVLATQTKDNIKSGAGSQHPHNGQVNFPIGTSRCDPYTSVFYDEQIANSGINVVTKIAGEFSTVKPQHYFRYHGWAARVPIDLSNVKGIFGQTYMRLIVENPNLPDDRHLTNYVGHLASDSYLRGATKPYKGDNGVSRYKKITNEWEPFNFFSGSWATKAELAANPPPFTSTP
jgi:hypothetical protein